MNREIKKPKSRIKSRHILGLGMLGATAGMIKSTAPVYNYLYKEPDFIANMDKKDFLDYSKTSGKLGTKKVAIGSGSAVAAGLGGYHLYKYLKHRKDPKNKITGKQLARNLGKSALIVLGTGAAAGLGSMVLNRGATRGLKKALDNYPESYLTVDKDSFMKDVAGRGAMSLLGAGVGVGVISGANKLKRLKYKKDESRDKETR